MSGRRQPIDLVIARGKKHLTREEIAARRAAEVAPATDDLRPPAYLTAAQKKHFVKLAGQLKKIRIMGETDVDTLARYVVAELSYQEAVKEQRRLARERPSDREAPDYHKQLELWYTAQETADRRQQQYFKQASGLARDLGLTISSRCRLQVPVKEELEQPVNKFARFGKAVGTDG